MKPTKTLFTGILLLATALFAFSSCSKNDSKPVPRTQSYKITPYGTHNISGTVLFKEILNTDSVQVTVTLKGQEINDLVTLPVKIRQGTSIEDGAVIADLGSYDGSQTNLMKTINMSFDNLLKQNASLAVYDNNGNILSQAEIGTNSTYTSFPMKGSSGDENGQFRIYQRPTGSYLVIKVDLKGIDDLCKGVDHPAQIANPNGIPDSSFVLNPVADSNGVSATTLSEQEYKDFINYSGSVKVLCSEAIQSATISSGKIK